MRIQVRDDTGKPLGAIQIKVVDLGESEVAQQNNSAWKRILDKIILRFAHATAESKKKNKALGQVKTVEINISLPSLSKNPLKKTFSGFRALPKRKKILSLAVCLALIALVTILTIFGGNNNQPAAASNGQDQPTLTRGTPKYSTALPAGKTIQQLGGWARVSPPGRSPVYAYVDKVGDVRVDVSEQPLPANFKNNTDDQIAQLAQNFSANDKVMAGDTAVYIGTSAEGPQSVILTKKKLLILIKSTSFITNEQWISYVNSLQ